MWKKYLYTGIGVFCIAFISSCSDALIVQNKPVNVKNTVAYMKPLPQNLQPEKIEVVKNTASSGVSKVIYYKGKSPLLGLSNISAPTIESKLKIDNELPFKRDGNDPKIATSIYDLDNPPSPNDPLLPPCPRGGVRVTAMGYNWISPSVVQQFQQEPILSFTFEYTQCSNIGSKNLSVNLYVDGVYVKSVPTLIYSPSNYPTVQISLPSSYNPGTHTVRVDISYQPYPSFEPVVFVKNILTQYTIIPYVSPLNVTRSGSDCVSWNNVGAAYYVVNVTSYGTDASGSLSEAIVYNDAQVVYSNQMCGIPIISYPGAGGISAVFVSVTGYNSSGQVVGQGSIRY
ncbi:MAG: hypothetical protein H9535_08275 [Ignavibacteria bacterium]|nr:hypothetical protein [Ignavibacteria bacterium]